MNLLRSSGMLVFLAGLAFAQLPDFYKKVSRVTWLVKDLDRAVQGWSKLGLSDVQEYGDIDFNEVEYRGKPASVRVRVATGFLGEVAVDMLQPVEGDNAFTAFLSKHGDGIFAIVHEAPDLEALDRETGRLRSLGAGLLQRMSIDAGNGPIVFHYFDTEPQGKYVLGLMHWPGGAPSGLAPGKLSQIAFVVRDPAAASAYWQKLGFPAMTKSHADPRPDQRYRGKPASFGFDMYWQRHTQLAYEWIVPPAEPNFYSEFLKAHGEGIQHLGVPVEDMDKAIAEYEKLGYKVAQSGAWGEAGKKGSGRYAYMDTDSIGGVSAELLWSLK